MPFRRALLALLLCTPLATSAELRTLSGKAVTGDVVSISDKEVVMQVGSERVVTPLEQVLQVDLAAVPPAPKAARYIAVELIDGSLLYCSEWTATGKQAELKLLSEQQIKLPLADISYVQTDAHDAKVRQEWKERFLGKKRNRDLLVVKSKEGVINGLEGTLGEVDAEGKSIDFTLSSGKKVPLPVTNIFGLIFLRGANPALAPVACTLYDTNGNVLKVSNLTQTKAGYTITTVSGLKIDYAPTLLARLDYSKGKLTYLSDEEAFWKPGKVKVTQSSTEDRIEKPRLNKNLDDGPIRLGGTTYPLGLSVHARTELDFDLGGDYMEFKAVIGVNDMVGGREGVTLVKIMGDGTELLSLQVARGDKPKPVTLNIKDVQRLRISVSSGDLLDLGRHVDIADAKVSK